MIKIKIGRNNYEITRNDVFMDNGHVVQLLSQSQENLNWGIRSDPCLSKKLYKQLQKDHKKINIKHRNNNCNVHYFSFET